MKKKAFTASCLLLMKITFVQIILAAVFSCSLYAKKIEAQDFLERKLTIAVKNEKKAQILAIIKRQTGASFIFSPEAIQADRPVDCNISNKKLKDFLSSELKDMGIGFKVIDNQLLLFPLAENKQPVDVLMPEAEHKQVNDIIIRGQVKDENGMPLNNVSVTEKATGKGTVTDEKGNFIINVQNNNAVLLFSYVGYVAQEVKAGAQKELNVVLAQSTSSLSDVVVIGYGTQKKITLTGSVASISGKELNTTTNSNVANMMAGKLPGFRVTQRNSEPGSYATDFDIRGLGSPLIIIDGVPRDNFARIDPNEVESISILKDASAAVYGVKAANGVMLITTKKGKTGAPTLNYNGTYGLTSVINTPKVMNAAEWMTLQNEQQMNTGGNPTYTADEIAAYENGTKTSTDWFDLVVRKRVPLTQHNLSATGGSERIKYFMSLGYYNELGFWKTNDLNYKRFNLRSNVTAQISKNLDAELLVGAIQDTKIEPGESTWVIFKSMWMQIPTIPVYANDNPLYMSNVADGTHPLAVTNTDVSGYNKTVTKTFQGNFALNYKIPFVDGLKARGMVSYDSRYLFNKNWKKQYALYTYDDATGVYTPTYAHSPSNLSEGFDQVEFTTAQLSLNYEKQFAEKHHLKALVLFEKLSQKINNFNASRQFSLDAIDQMYAGNNNSNQAGSSSSASGYYGISGRALFDYVREGLVGRLNYDYQGKYLVEGSFRYDGSSMFADGHRWGFFPAASAGWRISEENFFKDNITFINNFKLRASYGKMGDDASSNFQYLTGYNYPGGANYIFGSSYVPGLSPRGMANENLTWYTAELANFGFDADFLLNNKLHVEFDVFRRKRSGLLATKILSLPGTVGAGLPQENLNSDLQKGLELLLSYKDRAGGLGYNVSANISYTRSKYFHIERAQSTNDYRNWRDNNNDRWSDIYWGYHVIGRFTSMDEIKASPVQDGNGNRNLLPGDLKYQDINHDGIIDDNDITPVGKNSSTPQLNYGFTISLDWKGFDLNMLFQGGALFTVNYLGSDQLSAPMPWGRNGLEIFMDRWHRADAFDKNSEWIPGYYPSTRRDGTTNYWASDFWLLNAQYLRLKSVELGYTLPAQVLKRAGIKSLRVFANGFNVLTWSNMNKVVDPEHTSNTYGYEYPITRSMNFGLNLNF
ncbi:MAG: TonB-dependent receptor [Agriterribacter sp.]